MWKAISTKYLSQIDQLKAQLIGAQSASARAFAIMSAGTGDVEPTDEKARKDYVASAANFYDAILEKKLMQMIAEVRELEDTIFIDVPRGMNRIQYDFVLKGTSNAFKLLTEWGERMKGEHAANISKETNQ